MLKNIILDMGNVLLVYDPELYVENLSRPEAREVILKELFYGPDWPKQDLGIIGKPALFDLVSQRVPAEYHEDLKQVIFGWTDYMKPVKGAAAFLQKMKEAGYHLFVLSNAGFDFHDYFPSGIRYCQDHRQPDQQLSEPVHQRTRNQYDRNQDHREGILLRPERPVRKSRDSFNRGRRIEQDL